MGPRAAVTRTPDEESEAPTAPLRILHVCRRYYPLVGGTQKYVHDLAASQAQAGCKVTVLTLDRDTAGPRRGLPKREIQDGIEIIRIPGRGTPQIAFTFRPDRVWREVARHDVVHVHDARFAMASCLVGAVGAHRPRIFHTHGLIFHSGGGVRFKRLAMRFYFGPLLRLGRFRLIADSESDRALLLRDAPYLARATATCLNAIPIQHLLDLERTPEPGRIVSIGRIVPNKALPDLVEALSHLRGANWSLVLAGDPNPEELARVKAQVDELKLGDRVDYIFDFPEEALPGLLSSAQLAVFPSRGEGFGLALLEAMAAGVPLLARRIPAHEQLLGGELAGQLVDFDNPDETARSIGNMLLAGKAHLDSVSALLRAQALKYDIGRLRHQIEDLYRDIGVGTGCR